MNKKKKNQKPHEKQQQKTYEISSFRMFLYKHQQEGFIKMNNCTCGTHAFKNFSLLCSVNNIFNYHRWFIFLVLCYAEWFLSFASVGFLFLLKKFINYSRGILLLFQLAQFCCYLQGRQTIFPLDYWDESGFLILLINIEYFRKALFIMS